METLLALDQQILFFINDTLSNGFFDAILPTWREKTTWIPIYILMVAGLVWKYKKFGIILFLATVSVVGIGDLTSSRLVKKSFQRLRPCNEVGLEKTLNARIGCGRSYSFTSSHATNHFALSIFLILLLGNRFKWIRWPLFLWAVSIAFAQVYVGVHYPSDVFAGALLGSILAYLGMITFAAIVPNLRDNIQK